MNILYIFKIEIEKILFNISYLVFTLPRVWYNVYVFLTCFDLLTLKFSLDPEFFEDKSIIRIRILRTTRGLSRLLSLERYRISGLDARPYTGYQGGPDIELIIRPVTSYPLPRILLSYRMNALLPNNFIFGERFTHELHSYHT